MHYMRYQWDQNRSMAYFGLFHLYYRIRMNYNAINRNSLMSCIYSDRPGYNAPSAGDGWRPQEQHLNPSKSKLNIRHSLNKTVENGPAPSSTLASIRNSCLLTSAASSHPPRQDGFLQDKFFKASKENQQPVANPREHFPRYSQVLPVSEERRKSDSAHFRAASSNDFLFKLEDFRPFETDRDRPEKQERGEKAEKTQPAEAQLREMLIALTKRVASNEEEIARLKEKDRRGGGLEGEVGELKGKLMELARFQSKVQGQLEGRMQQQQQEMRERLAACEDAGKRYTERGISDLTERLKSLEEMERQLGAQVTSLQTSSRKLNTEEMPQIRSTLDLAKKEACSFSDRLKRLQAEVAQKLANSYQDYKKSTRKSLTSIMLQNREVLLVRENQPVRDRSRPPSFPQSRRDLAQEHSYSQSSRLGQAKRELIIRQKVYYIDTSGYLLDENKYYLLNSKNEQILLPEQLIAALRENNMLATANGVLNTPRR